jgi:hypothetical protein
MNFDNFCIDPSNSHNLCKKTLFYPYISMEYFQWKKNWFGNDLVPKTCLKGFGDALVEF